jgi:uncharacterized damage-inducible protein DinB
MNKTKWLERKFKFDLPQEDFNSILIRLLETPDKVEQLVLSISPDLLIKKTNSGWSIQEHIGHLVDLEELHEGRITDFKEGNVVLRAADMKNIKTEESNHNMKDIKELLTQMRELRTKFVYRLKELDDKVLAHVVLHPRLNQPMRPVDMAYFVAEHDEHHINSMIELKKEFSE